MGFLKKITRPISRVLDKIVPNEIKPALPFLAAAAPFLAPGIMGAFGGSMLSRGLISGGLNLGSQLAQEGSDGDFSGLSTLMAAATGALSTPGSAATTGPAGPPGSELITTPGQPSAADFFRDKAAGMQPGLTKSGLGALETSSNYLTGVSDTLQNELFSKAGLKAALVPIGQGMTDLAVAENRRALKDYEREQADYEAGMDEENSNRAFAIRQSMEAYGFTEQEILDAIEAAGYRAGGRVGLSMGGDPDFSGIKGAVMSINENMRADRSGDFFRLREEAIQKGDSDKIKEIESDFFREFGTVMPKMAKDGGRINFDNGGFEPFKYTSKIPRVFKEDPFGSDPLGQILNMSYTVRAPLIDIIRTVAKTATEATKLAAAAVKLGYDVTEPVREVVGDIAGGIYDVAKKSVQESGDASRFIQPMYYLERFGPEKNLTDDETRLKRLKRSIGRDDRDLIKTIENRIFGYDDAGMDQSEEDKEVSDKIQTKIDERNFGFAEGGLMNLGGKEMDLRKGGFVPIGKKERADDVPARLSKNEFVMTADAVRAAGGGSVNEGAKRMYDVMNKLEARA